LEEVTKSEAPHVRTEEVLALTGGQTRGEFECRNFSLNTEGRTIVSGGGREKSGETAGTRARRGSSYK